MLKCENFQPPYFISTLKNLNFLTTKKFYNSIWLAEKLIAAKKDEKERKEEEA